MYIVRIPIITSKELITLYQSIRPIVTIYNKKYWLREFSVNEVINFSYLTNVLEDKREPVDMSDLIELYSQDFECIHKYSYPGVFEPKIAEVLAQIPNSDRKSLKGFEIINKPVTLGDMNKNKIVFENGFHISTVRLYGAKE